MEFCSGLMGSFDKIRPQKESSVMPVSAEKIQELAVRREVEQKLFSLGLTLQDMEKIFGVHKGSIRNDLEKIGGRDVFPVVSGTLTERRDRAYKSALILYAQMCHPGFSSKTDHDSHVNKTLHKALEVYLEIGTIHGIAVGIASVINDFVNPVDPDMYVPYRTLLQKIFGSLVMEVFGQTIFVNYLENIAATSEAPTQQYLAKDMKSFTWANFEQFFSVPLGEPAKRAIDQILLALPPREEKILRMRFGLGQEVKKLVEIARYYCLSRQRIFAIEAKALRCLRGRCRSVGLDVLVQSPYVIAERFLDLQFSPPLPPAPEEMLVAPSVPVENVDRAIEEFDLSVRAYNCLVDARIRTVGELVQKTEAEMLRIKNFGYKCLRELKELLHSMNLCFDMKMVNGKIACLEAPKSTQQDFCTRDTIFLEF